MTTNDESKSKTVWRPPTLDGAYLGANGNWKHPTGGEPESVSIIALGPTGADYHGLNFRYDPALPAADEVWTVNKGFRTIKADLVFIMDDLIGEMRQSQRYYEDIIKCGLPIITSEIDSQVYKAYSAAKLTEFPLIPVLDFYAARHLHAAGTQNLSGDELTALRRELLYLQNSIPFMLAYAGAIGVKTINLFGADYDFPGSSIHEGDKPNTEYWCGVLRMCGVKINRSERTTLLQTHKGQWVYGYGARQPIV